MNVPEKGQWDASQGHLPVQELASHRRTATDRPLQNVLQMWRVADKNARSVCLCV